ncbi:tRNA preQ1(34) S-adenosylmethionine ribosyltransferase-isomerase QueA [Natranaerobius thermophilus]|uniref:S-adenosylmethionine:tRNA ribosyltransferase-isomerase n=1 Tax=Natranaerobius thermophilus (strain ATCC BAA-1301 / DSM 18059 / JW/NM-WN-LF) TaxID=457570 RepID=QUEA_NATTJ|nr:tRNA preQ1(34) S-adenosylmethionine ribosyltransferase-isomerase QueA [Natranaerobius thermophilus]B2A5L1.1 RecName: Full=S-adenosylmethionine:tRNA ribosyltransferase-isomerase; AltName: Full=Queuosine biosynthesis protein QueA [Natranaerobius thermophilus JW/NM-WN-LF]ACB85365.1 S-adenosylmethionine--tRNA-ribosyltransferase-isomerase [Natranaerobius thermophilus JW/NM-WN-LF]
MKLEEFNYELPEELIAQKPLANRSKSRLMVVSINSSDVQHNHFEKLPQYVKDGDLFVINNSRVIPARLFGNKKQTGGKLEMVLLHPLEGKDEWEVLVKPGKRAKPGNVFEFGQETLEAEILDITPEGSRRVKFYYQGNFQQVLDQLGQMPLPPYIKEELEDPERYQTVYAKESGSVAAPTAGLHFTPEIISDIKDQGGEVAELTLHVGLGTFRPVETPNIEEHEMHAEYYQLPEETAKKINQAKQRGNRVIAVGTTVVRTLETVKTDDGLVQPGKGWTDIFIYPGYEFKVVDAMLTNFHLPKSTLLMLVSAFAGKDLIMSAYQAAIEERYRFFSFGDAMFIKN